MKIYNVNEKIHKGELESITEKKTIIDTKEEQVLMQGNILDIKFNKGKTVNSQAVLAVIG